MKKIPANRKIIFFSNTSWYLLNFRLALLFSLQKQGYEIVLVAPEDSFSDKLRASGFRFIPINLHRSSLNPFNELRVFFDLLAIYAREKPDLLHHYTVKCVLYGSIAGWICGVRAIVNSVTGLGHVFLSTSWLMRVVRFFVVGIYRILSCKRGLVFLFQNQEDKKLFADFGIARGEKSILVHGSGVDTKKIIPNFAQPGKKTRLLFASRLLKEKGLIELMDALRALKKEGLDFEFHVAGQLDKGNPSFISESELKVWCEEGIIVYLGSLENIHEELKQCDIVVLPSWREGLPKILIEAGAAGKAIITTDVPGCREVVQDGLNGLLVPVRDSIALAAAMRVLIQDEKLRGRLGAEARKKTVAEFDQEIVHEKTMKLYTLLLSQA